MHTDVKLITKYAKQECIPVGCVPSAAVAVSPATHAPPPPRHACSPTTRPMHTLLPCMPPYHARHPATPHAPPPTPPWTAFLTHASSTSFADGKNTLRTKGDVGSTVCSFCTFRKLGGCYTLHDNIKQINQIVN